MAAHLLLHDDQTITLRGERFRIYLDAKQIQARVHEIGSEITRDYDGKRPILIGILNGAFMFLSDLMKSLRMDCEVDFMKLSSYGAEMITSGVVRELKKTDADLEGRHVLIVEDIVDSGLTLSWIKSNLESRSPASVEICTLLRKPDAAKVEVEVKWVGFDIPNEFVIGYGLDYAEKYRNLPFIGVMKG